MSENNRPQNPLGPPDPPKCRHGKIFSAMRSNCQECVDEDNEIKSLVYPLVDKYWESKGQGDLYHLIYMSYHMGMRNEHLEKAEEIELPPEISCGECREPRSDKNGGYITPCPHCGDEIPF